MLRILTTAVLVLIGGGTSTGAQPQRSKVSADIEELLWWLPPDTETVQVTHTPTSPRGPCDAFDHTRGEIGSSAARD